jgi:3'-5' exoribonuclease
MPPVPTPSAPPPPGGGASGSAPALPAGSIATFRAGDVVRGTFACVRKDRLTAKTGSTYLAVELRDRTGSIGGRVFRDADLVASRFDRGDLVHVQARVERFREELQLDIAQIARAPAGDADPASFLPVAYRDMEELDGFLEHLAREVHDPGYGGLLLQLLGDEALRTALRRTPCSRAGHHAYLGGLLEHTVAVATLAQETCLLHPRLNSDLLICAAIVHDLGHTQSFVYGAEIALSEAGRLLGHVELGLRIVDGLAARVPAMDATRTLQLAHCVLTHHGPDSAPGRRFGSVEALTLARLNALDASVKGALEQGLP